jgi:ubiquinone/menaquinone biosynthesis C-methylase UbiE
VTPDAHRYLYFAADLRTAARFDGAGLPATTERHQVELQVPPLAAVANASAELTRLPVEGVVFELTTGLPSTQQLVMVNETLRHGSRAWFYWPGEQAVECVDDDRLESLRRQRTGVKWLTRLAQPVDRAVTIGNRVPTALRWIYRGEFPVRRSDLLTKLTLMSARAQPVALETCGEPGAPPRIPGVGVYMRTDYWTRSTEDTRQVAAELAAVGERLVCLMPRHDPPLDEADVRQVVMDEPRVPMGEDGVVLAPVHYLPIVNAACQTLRPAYLYERLCAGETVGAELSQALQLPYVVQYAGSQDVLREAVGEAAPFYPEIYAKAEELALRQATVVVVPSSSVRDALVARGVDATRVLIHPGDLSNDAPHGTGLGSRLAAFADARTRESRSAATIQTGDAYKDQVQAQWNNNPIGSQYARGSQPQTLEWFLEIEKHRYATYAPWMPKTMEFGGHAGHDVLEVGGGVGTDLAQFAAHGARVTDLDLSAGHLRLAEENFRLRGLEGRFIHHDAESLPFDDRSFDLVYSNGVLHHTPNTLAAVHEIHRVLRPGGRAIVMVYAESSLHFWRKLVWQYGVQQQLLDRMSMGEIMSRSVERTANDARPLVKVYTRPRLRRMFAEFPRVEILQRQLLAEELPYLLQWTLPLSERCLGWNLIIKATKR